MKHISQVSRCPGRGSNLSSSEYESRELVMSQSVMSLFSYSLLSQHSCPTVHNLSKTWRTRCLLWLLFARRSVRYTAFKACKHIWLPSDMCNPCCQHPVILRPARTFPISGSNYLMTWWYFVSFSSVPHWAGCCRGNTGLVRVMLFRIRTGVSALTA